MPTCSHLGPVHQPACFTHTHTHPESLLHHFRVVEYVSSLEHSHFSDGSSQPPVTITQTQQASTIMGTPELNVESVPELELNLSHPVIQPTSIQELLRENSHTKGFDLRGGSLLTGTSAAKVVCTLSTQADRYHTWRDLCLLFSRCLFFFVCVCGLIS